MLMSTELEHQVRKLADVLESCAEVTSELMQRRLSTAQDDALYTTMSHLHSDAARLRRVTLRVSISVTQ